jgi:hypothetical protein
LRMSEFTSIFCQLCQRDYEISKCSMKKFYEEKKLILFNKAC